MSALRQPDWSTSGPCFIQVHLSMPSGTVTLRDGNGNIVESGIEAICQKYGDNYRVSLLSRMDQAKEEWYERFA